MNLSIPMHMDSDKSITPAYKVSSYPTLFVLDKEGKVEDVIFGAKPDLKAMLDKDVTKLLAGKSLLSDDGKKAGGSDAAAMRAKPASAKRLEVAPNNKSDGAKERTEKKSDDK